MNIVIEIFYLTFINKMSKKNKGFKDVYTQLQDQRITKQKIEKMTKHEYEDALDYYDQFQQTFLKNIDNDLKQIRANLNTNLAHSIRKLEFKLKGGYMNSLSDTIKSFDIEGFIEKQIKSVYNAISDLKEKIYEYINKFSEYILSQNVIRTQQNCLFNYTNSIRSYDDIWKSVTSRNSLLKATVVVKGFERPHTSWLALGVSKKKKEYGPVHSTIAKQDFMGNIYLNGTNQFSGGYKIKRDLSKGDCFQVICENRMVTVKRQNEIVKKNEIFILQDNAVYYVYLAVRGPLQIDFKGE